MGLLTGQTVMAVLLAVKEFPFPPLLLLPAASSIVFRVAVSRHFDRPLKNLSLHAAADLDRSEEVRPLRAPPHQHAGIVATLLTLSERVSWVRACSLPDSRPQLARSGPQTAAYLHARIHTHVILRFMMRSVRVPLPELVAHRPARRLARRTRQACRT